MNTSDFAARRDAWKRETRDDLDFPLPSHTKQTIFYDFPRPGGLPTPDSCASPVGFLPLRKDSLAPSSIAESDGIIEVNMSALQMEIGMAIGSPTQAPAAWQQQLYQQQNYSPSPDMSIESRVAPQPTKHKSKWKVFGGLFGGKKQTIQTQNFYQLRAERTPVEPEYPTPIRGWTTTEQYTEKQKPNVLRSHTAPDRVELHHEQNENPEILIDGSRVEEGTQLRPQAAGLLNVDIPDVQMERYSVMFGSLLGKPSESTPSLLARRQATLDRLKVANEELAQRVCNHIYSSDFQLTKSQEKELEEMERHIKQPRRATSPQPNRSPAFSLFPNTPSRDLRVERSASPHRLARSNTSPAALSPSRPSFAPGPENEIHANLMEPGPHIPIVNENYTYESEIPSKDRPSSVVPQPLVLKKPDLHSVVKMAQAKAQTETNTAKTGTTTTITAQPQQHPHPLRSFSISGRKQVTTSPEEISFPAPPVQKQTSMEALRKSSIKASPSVSGSTTSHSDHSASASGSSVSTTELLQLQTPLNSAAFTRAPSPQPETSAKQLPIPISKFTAPPQTHKTRGRSQTTSSPSTTKSSLPRPSSRPRNQGPTQISGPMNLASVPLPVSISPKPTTPPSASAKHRSTAKEEEDDEEARLSRLADVSIARQISVSRQQRQLLVPIKGSLRGKSPTVVRDTTSTSPPSTTSPPIRPLIRARASTVSASSPGNKIHDQNFPSPLQNLQSSGVNVAHLTSPLAAVEKAATALSPSNSTSNIPKLKKKESRKDMLHDAKKGSMPTLVVVTGSGRPQDEVESWEGAMVTPRKEISIAERRRKARAEKMGTGVEERRGHEYKKSEKVIVERI